MIRTLEVICVVAVLVATLVVALREPRRAGDMHLIVSVPRCAVHDHVLDCTWHKLPGR